MIIQVHDEILVDCLKSEIDRVEKITKSLEESGASVEPFEVES